LKRLENLSENMWSEIDQYIKDYGNSFDLDNPNRHIRKRILIVDDQGFNIDALMIILKYSIKLKDLAEICDCVYDGNQALELIIKDVAQNKF
jgi:hypothetical protein